MQCLMRSFCWTNVLRFGIRFILIDKRMKTSVLTNLFGFIYLFFIFFRFSDEVLFICSSSYVRRFFLWYIFKCGLFCSTNCEREIFCSLMSKIVDQTMTSYWNRNDILFGVCVCVMSNWCFHYFKSRRKLLLLLLCISFEALTHGYDSGIYVCIFSHLFEKLQCLENVHCVMEMYTLYLFMK